MPTLTSFDLSECQENRKLGVHSLVENYRIIKSPVKITDKVNAVFDNTCGQIITLFYQIYPLSENTQFYSHFSADSIHF